MQRTVSSIALALLACACTVPPGPARRGAPAHEASACIPVPAEVREARRHARRHDGAGALRALAAERPLSVHEPERAWLLAMLWPTRCASVRARREAAALPPSDVGDALRAATAEDPERGLAVLRARRSCGAPGWRHLAAAYLHTRLGDDERALAAGSRAGRSRRDFVRQEAEILRCRALIELGRLGRARDAGTAAHEIEPEDTRPLRLLAEIERRDGNHAEGARHLLAAVRAAPGSERAARRLADLLREGVAEVEPVVDALGEGLADLDPAASGNPELAALAALVHELHGRTEEAVALYRRALADGAVAVPLDRHLRRLLFTRGDFRAGVALLLEAVPPDVFEDPANLLRARWTAVRPASAAAPDRTATPERRLALARALVGVGALAEAVSTLAGLTTAEAARLRRRVEGHLAFEAALREEIEAGYRVAMRQDEPPDLRAVFAAMTRHARRHLVAEDQPAFERPERGLRTIPLLGSWLDHSTATGSPVVAHFRRYGRFLMLGQRGGTPPEAVVLSLASLSCAQPIHTAGCRYRHDVAVGYDRALRAFIAAQGGQLGGACLADGVWFDADTARRTDHGLRRRLLRDPSYLPAVQASGALPLETLDGAYALTDPGCTAARLLARYVERHPRSAWGTFGTLRAHEFSHVADVRRHLPIWRGLPATLALFVGHGLSATNVEMEMERRAQLGACVDAPDPDLALAEMLRALPLTDRDADVHDGGYRNGLRDLVLHIAAHPARFPRIDPTRRIVTQLDRLSNDEIRRAAKAVLKR